MALRLPCLCAARLLPFSLPRAVSQAGFGDAPGARVPSTGQSSLEAWASRPSVRSELGLPAPHGWRKLRAGGAGGDRGWVTTVRPRLRPVRVSPETPLCDSLFTSPRRPRKAERLVRSSRAQARGAWVSRGLPSTRGEGGE